MVKQVQSPSDGSTLGKKLVWAKANAGRMWLKVRSGARRGTETQALDGHLREQCVSDHRGKGAGLGCVSHTELKQPAQVSGRQINKLGTQGRSRAVMAL